MADVHKVSSMTDDAQQICTLAVPSSSQEPKISNHEHPRIEYLKGWRLHTLTLSLCLALFLSTIETTIVSTALVAITNALSGFERGNWVVTSYLLTYSGFLVILSKLSDIFGRKPLMIFTVFLFTVFSAGCGAAQKLTDLIVLRAFQGIGGGGIYTLVFVISLQIVPPEGLASLSGILSSAYAFSAVLGPLLGGLISDRTTWRWVFLMNVPLGAIVIVLLFLAMPAGFPYRTNRSEKIAKSFNTASIKKIDFVGAFLVLAASILFVSMIEEGGTEYSWSSATVLSLLCISLALWIAVFVWQKMAVTRFGEHEPILPWHLLANRFTVGFLL